MDDFERRKVASRSERRARRRRGSVAMNGGFSGASSSTSSTRGGPRTRYGARSSASGAGKSASTVLRERVTAAVEEFELASAEERDRFETAIVTLHDKVASLKAAVDLEKTRSKRQQELIDALQQQLRDSQLVENLQSKERLVEQGKLVQEVEQLRAEMMALRFQVLNDESLKAKREILNGARVGENADPNVKEPLSHSEKLVHAARTGDLESIRSLLNPSREIALAASVSFTEALSQALASAAGSTEPGSLETVTLLLTCGADPFSAGDSWNAVQKASECGNEKALERVLGFVGKRLKDELERKTKQEGFTALHLAAKGNHVGCILLLLKQGADPNALDLENRTPADLVKAGGDGESGNNKENPVLKALDDKTALFWSFSARANRLYGLEDFAGAKEAYDEALKLAEDSEDRKGVVNEVNRATLFYNSARTCVKVNCHSEAIHRSTKAIELKNGFYPNALAQRAASYMALFDFERAVQDYEALLSQQHAYSPSAAADYMTYLARARENAAKARDHYYNLGLDGDASQQEVKQAFRKQCLKWHPDKHRGSEDDTAKASIMFKAINEANEVLSDEQKRTLYDIDRISKRMDDIVRRQHEEQDKWQSRSPPTEPTKRSRHPTYTPDQTKRPHPFRRPTGGGVEEDYDDDEDDDDDDVSSIESADVSSSFENQRYFQRQRRTDSSDMDDEEPNLRTTARDYLNQMRQRSGRTPSSDMEDEEEIFSSSFLRAARKMKADYGWPGSDPRSEEKM